MARPTGERRVNIRHGPVSGTGRADSAPESALTARVIAQGPQEVDPAEVRPQRFAEVELAVCGLPHQEAREALFAGGADPQVGIGLHTREEVCVDFLQDESTGLLRE